MYFLLEVIQPPTGVTIVLTGRSTAQVMWNSVSTVLLYQVTLSASGNTIIIKNTSLNNMDISNLAPCTNYTVGVSSLNAFLVPGEPSSATVLIPSEYFFNRNY